MANWRANYAFQPPQQAVQPAQYEYANPQQYDYGNEEAGDFYAEDDEQYYQYNYDPNAQNVYDPMYGQGQGGHESEDDEEGDEEEDEEEEDVQINGNKPVKLVAPKNEEPQFELPKQPIVPEILEPVIPDIKNNLEELEKHCGFAQKIAHNLIATAESIRLYHPKLDKNLQETKLKNLIDENTKKTIIENENLKKKINDLTLEVKKLTTKKTIINDQKTELEELRLVSRNFGDLDSKYVKTIWKQNQIYRQNLIKMGQQAVNYETTLTNALNNIKICEQNMGLINNELMSFDNEKKALEAHIKFLEDSKNEKKEENNESELKEKNDEISKLNLIIKEKDNEINKIKNLNLELTEKITELSEKLESGQSEKVAMKDQIQQHAAFQARQQMKNMEETLSKMTVEQIQKEDEFNQKMKEEQEKSDKYRAKYESVKQHVKTLEMQKGEYTRVNGQLRDQNNQFRTMITQLQNQLRSSNKMQKQPIQKQYDDDNGSDGGGGIGPFAQMNRGGMRGGPMMRGRGGPPMRGRGGPPPQFPMRGGPMMRGRGGGVMPPGAPGAPGGAPGIGRGGNPMMRGNHPMMRGRGGPGPGPGINSHIPAQSAAQIHAPIQKQQQHQQSQSESKISKPILSDNNQYKPQRELWGKRTKTISEKGNKKRVLVEWHFVTSDNQPHTVVLQHTQDNKPKTRRMLWVDGSEKYNNKSSASSFRIEIDKDVVVASIDYVDSQYQYRLNINAMNYTEAFNLWKSRQNR